VRSQGYLMHHTRVSTASTRIYRHLGQRSFIVLGAPLPAVRSYRACALVGAGTLQWHRRCSFSECDSRTCDSVPGDKTRT